MKKIKWLKRLIVLAVIVGLGAGATTAYAVPQYPDDWCTGVFGGEWHGDSYEGTCIIYNPACEFIPSATGMYDVLHMWFDGETWFTPIGLCVPYPAGGHGPNIDLVKGDEEGGTASAKDWSVDYPTGACDETPCRLNVGHIPTGAGKVGLPGMVGSAYFKTDSSDPYKICYSGADANMLYQFVSGAWVPVPTTWYGDMICTTATGPGAFAAVFE
jgi:hypothetical protein